MQLSIEGAATQVWSRSTYLLRSCSETPSHAACKHVPCVAHVGLPATRRAHGRRLKARQRKSSSLVLRSSIRVPRAGQPYGILAAGFKFALMGGAEQKSESFRLVGRCCIRCRRGFEVSGLRESLIFEWRDLPCGTQAGMQAWCPCSRQIVLKTVRPQSTSLSTSTFAVRENLAD